MVRARLPFGPKSTPGSRSSSTWRPDREPRTSASSSDVETDVLIVGAGIAGVATAFFVLRDTPMRVLLVERDRVGRGATGRNAGQLTTYFERPLASIAQQFGEGPAVDAQRAFDDAHDLLDLMAAEAGAGVRVERFTGHMGLFTLNHVTVHLRNNLVRRRGGLRQEACVISEDADVPRCRRSRARRPLHGRPPGTDPGAPRAR